MEQFPILMFRDPIRLPRQNLYGGAPHLSQPTHAQQVNRLSSKFQELSNFLAKGRAELKMSSEGIDPEYTLVLEVAGTVDSFRTAIKNINKSTANGIEWIFEAIDLSVDNDEDFFCMKEQDTEYVRDDTKTMTFKYFCVMTNLQALEEILSLWDHYQKDEHYTFPWGKTGLRDVFKNLRDIHRWGIKERLEETGILAAWQDDLKDPECTDVTCEIELCFRRSEIKREQSQKIVERYITSIGGAVLATSCIKEIEYHALLAKFPRNYAERIIQRDDVKLVALDYILFIKPTSQSIVLGIGDGFEYPKMFKDFAGIDHEPIVALFDGLPQENHPLLRGMLSVDDPDDYASMYPSKTRQHGTSMASLIARGDLQGEESSLLSSKIYVRPIMKPYLQPDDNTGEGIPEDILIVDLIHQAIKRLFDQEAGRVAPTVKIINLSIGFPIRMYYHLVSPLARLLDWLSFKYRVLFIVSAGNHPADIDLAMPFDEFAMLDIDDKDETIIQALDKDARSRRLLSPAESINALTIGAWFSDLSNPKNIPYQVLPCSSLLPSPINPRGRGVNKSVKPELYFPGGRNFVHRALRHPQCASWTKGAHLNPPGILSASPVLVEGTRSRVSYTFGTSNATAIASHNGAICYETLQDIFMGEGHRGIPDEYVALLVKAMLVHGCEWNDEAKSKLIDALDLSGRGADEIYKWMGYGVPNIPKVLACAKNRVTLMGYGELQQDTAVKYLLPLPFNFSSQRMKRCLTITMATFVPVTPSVQKYRTSQLWYTVDKGGLKVLNSRADIDAKAAIRGTIQHERFVGNRAINWDEDGNAVIQVNCRADASSCTLSVPYALMATFEIAPEHNIDVYHRIAAKIKIKEPVKII